MNNRTVKVAMIGVGAISGIYLENIAKVFKEVELIGVCDLIPERAQKGVAYMQEQKDNGVNVTVPRIYDDMYEAFNDPEVEVILNLTRPYEHYDVTKAALLHGKHVYSEKPLAVDMEEGTELVKIAQEKELLLGGAPDTFMGAGIQTCRKLIDDGMIGDIVGANCEMICHGHESWHPDPEFYYKRGGGPMMDMGPYYVTALVQLLGEAKSVVGMTKKSFPQRLITSQPHNGEIIDVDVDTHLTGSIEFTSGAIAQICTTFDVHYTGQARFEVYGTRGTMVVPDPNCFGGPVVLHTPGKGDEEIPLAFDYPENSRALGLAEMAAALKAGRRPRASYKQTLHVLEVLTGFERAAAQGGYLELTTKYDREAPMEQGLPHGVLK